MLLSFFRELARLSHASWPYLSQSSCFSSSAGEDTRAFFFDADMETACRSVRQASSTQSCGYRVRGFTRFAPWLTFPPHIFPSHIRTLSPSQTPSILTDSDRRGALQFSFFLVEFNPSFKFI